MSKPVVILGLGNILLADEGFGVHIIRELEKQPLPEYVELIDAGTAGLDMLLTLKDTGKLIIIDSITNGQAPGTIYCLHPQDLGQEQAPSIISLHQISVLATLALVKRTGSLPEEIVIIGIEPKRIDWGLGLSEEIQAKIPQVLDIVTKEITAGEKAEFYR